MKDMLSGAKMSQDKKPAMLPSMSFTLEVQRFLLGVATEVYNGICLKLETPHQESQFAHFAAQYGQFLEDRHLASLPNEHEFILAKLRDAPTLSSVYGFLVLLFKEFKLSKVRFICALAYVRRFIEETRCPLYSSTWRPVFLVAFILSHKMEDDETYLNEEFVDVYPLVSKSTLLKMEITFFKVLKFNAYLSVEEYSEFATAVREHMDTLLSSKMNASDPSPLTVPRLPKLVDHLLPDLNSSSESPNSVMRHTTPLSQKLPELVARPPTCLQSLVPLKKATSERSMGSASSMQKQVPTPTERDIKKLGHGIKRSVTLHNVFKR
eukprot:GILJ01002924.1.p1 GENE.GILJ01002924.1~~GILJ01002924.1.p1  ORF type:complete len:340 (+),score=31.68 GILJ01002924.1:52-1020(+)